MMRGAIAIAGLAALIGGGAIAQTIQEEAAALLSARREAEAAARRSARFEAEAVRATTEAARARAAEAAVAARIQAAEADIEAAQSRIDLVERLRARQRARLAAKQEPVVRLAAALQTMARRPPALAIVQPGSLADLAHVRALLATTMPRVRARTASLRAEVAQGDRLRAQADAAAATLVAGQQRLKDQRDALAALEARHRTRSAALGESAILESDRALALGEDARDIADLMADLGEQAQVRARLAGLPGPVLRPPVPGSAATPPPDAVAAAGGSRRYRLPVVGRVVTGLGEVSESGARARGLTIAAAANAQVVAPAGGRISFAGPFRGYGRIAILDHGGGWTSVVTGLETLSVRVGESVDAGSPLGRAGPGRPQVTVELRRGNRPVDIARLVSG
ncbi:peptidoglycan DD-metalloendopeptidase family protein [Sphingomonas sp. 1P06PA]|uniref:murein hydrolase activator EnvC family protein n=1 Tax=Sphingomonas sp. 1P06PA TaxID=554121 RepID=UPI0039A57715